MINKEKLEKVSKNITSLADRIQDNIVDYISMSVDVEDAELIRMEIDRVKSDIYDIAKSCDDSDAEELITSFPPIEVTIQQCIGLTVSMMAMLDRYIAECYVTKIEKIHNPNVHSVNLEYCSDFKNCKDKNPRNKKPLKMNNPKFIKSTVHIKGGK